MAIKSLGAYDFPAKDRQEVYGDNQLVNVLWQGNMLFCSPACFLVPRTMTWGEFRSEVVDPWAGVDPDFRPEDAGDWRRDSDSIDPRPDQTIADLGIAHKGLVSFRTP